MFRALCKIILSFFQDNSTDAVTSESNESKVGCNGKAVKMFAEMIKCSSRDDDFESRKCTMFNVPFLLSYLLLMVRFVNNFMCIFLFLLS